MKMLVSDVDDPPYFCAGCGRSNYTAGCSACLNERNTMGINVTLAGGMYFGNQPQREHLTGVSWRVTKKKRLLIFDGDGKEVARYKDHRWSDVWLADVVADVLTKAANR